MCARIQSLQAADIDFPPEDWNCISREAHNLVNSLICVNVDKRLSAKQVLTHPWITKMMGSVDVEAKPTTTSGRALPNLAKAKGNMKVRWVGIV